MNQMIETINREFDTYVVIFEKGTFCNVYGKSSYVVSYLFDYRIKEVGNNLTCGFPKSSINKVRAILESKKINYMIVNKTHNYEEDDKCEFKENNYEKTYEQAFRYVSLKRRIENIGRYCLNNINNEKVLEIINRCEEYINETGKVYSDKPC